MAVWAVAGCLNGRLTIKEGKAVQKADCIQFALPTFLLSLLARLLVSNTSKQTPTLSCYSYDSLQ